MHRYYGMKSKFIKYIKCLYSEYKYIQFYNKKIVQILALIIVMAIIGFFRFRGVGRS